MKIHSVSNLRSNSVKRSDRARHDSAAGFAEALGSEPAASASAAAAGQVGALGSLLAAQEVGEAGERDRDAARRGSGLLDQLDALRFEILTGKVSRARLQRLGELLAVDHAAAEDPRLAEAIAEIELRVAVELAKLER